MIILRKTIKIKVNVTNSKISFWLSIFKYSKIFLNKSLKKYVSGLIKRFINGINSAIEIDSHRDAKIERVSI